MEDELPMPAESTELKVSGHAVSYLGQTRKWTLFISIIGFIFIGLCLIGSVFFWVFVSPSVDTPVPVQYFSFLYVLIAFIYFFPVYYLYQFSSNIEMALEEKDSLNLESAFGYLKSHYKFLGIFIIVTMGFYLLFFLGVSIFGKFI